MLTSREFSTQLQRRGESAGVSISDDTAKRLEAYLRLLTIWNEKINLTALPLTPPTDETFDRLLIEPLIAATHVRPEVNVMLDVGSGGGSPAIPMAIATPGLRLRMLESKSRKSVFLREAARVAELEGAEVITARLRDAASQVGLRESLPLITVRGVLLDRETLGSLVNLTSPGGQIFFFAAGRLADLDEWDLHEVAVVPLRTAHPSELSIWERDKR